MSPSHPCVVVVVVVVVVVCFILRLICRGEKCFIEKHLLLQRRIRTKRKKKKKKSDNEQPAKESTSETSGKREDGFEGRERRTTGVVMCANT